MPTVIITHEVKDFAEWKKGFDSHEPARKAGLIETNGVYQDIAKPNLVTVITKFPSEEAVKAFMGNPDIEAVMKASGVISMPEVKVLKLA